MIEPTTTIRLSETEKAFLKGLAGEPKDARYTTGISSTIKRLIREEMQRQAARDLIEQDAGLRQYE